jgi:hypothetical protein
VSNESTKRRRRRAVVVAALLAGFSLAPAGPALAGQTWASGPCPAGWEIG